MYSHRIDSALFPPHPHLRLVQTPADASDRCIRIANEGPPASVELDEANVVVDERSGALHLGVGALTTNTVRAVVEKLEERPGVPVVFQIAPGTSTETLCEVGLDAVFELSECMKRYDMPIVTVVEGDAVVEGAWCVLLAEVDIVIMSEASCVSLIPKPNDGLYLHSSIMASRLSSHVADRAGCAVSAADALEAGLADMVVPVDKVDRKLDAVLNRFAKSGFGLVRACKTSLPAPSLDAAALVMARLGAGDATPSTGNLVRLSVSDDGVAAVELNDPVRYNDMGPELLGDLLLRMREVEALASAGDVKVMVLSGVGPHFCTGGSAANSPVMDWATLTTHVSMASEATEVMRALPIPTFAAVHGKLIGGGVALALAADWRVCAAGTTFNFGNRSRNKNPLFMLSRAMQLNVGQGVANVLYLEEPEVAAEEAKGGGLVHQVVPSIDDAKREAGVLANAWVSGRFVHGPISRMCSNDRTHSARECMLFGELDGPLGTKKQALTKEIVRVVPKVVRSTPIDPRWHGLSDEEIRKVVYEEVCHACSSTLGDEAVVADDTPLMEAGLDSLGSTELVNVLTTSTGLKLDPTLLFSHPTIGQLTEHITGVLLKGLTPVEEFSTSNADPRWNGFDADSVEEASSGSSISEEAARLQNTLAFVPPTISAESCLVQFQRGRDGITPVVFTVSESHPPLPPPEHDMSKLPHTDHSVANRPPQYAGVGTAVGRELGPILGPEVPLYGMLSPEVAARPTAFPDLEARVSHHYAELRAHFSDCAIRLVGYSVRDTLQGSRIAIPARATTYTRPTPTLTHAHHPSIVRLDPRVWYRADVRNRGPVDFAHADRPSTGSIRSQEGVRCATHALTGGGSTESI